MRQVTNASQRPVVGNALNWQGQPQLQLQLANSSPAIRHFIRAGPLIFSTPLSFLNSFQYPNVPLIEHRGVWKKSSRNGTGQNLIQSLPPKFALQDPQPLA
jgi:hypothetical protein